MAKEKLPNGGEVSHWTLVTFFLVLDRFYKDWIHLAFKDWIIIGFLRSD
jgi:hypothetical protein